MSGRRKRLVTIVIRGCTMRVSPEMARELVKEEKKLVQKEWNTNQLP